MALANSGFKASLDASIQLKPKKNQALVIICFVCSALFSVIGCLFLWFDKNGLYFPFGVSALFGLASVGSFLLTYRGGELSDKEPFEIIHTPDGVNVRMDPTLFLRRQDVANVVALMANTRNLPIPAGMIDEAGNIIPNSQHQAEKVANEANKSIEGVIRKNMDRVIENPNIADQGSYIIQSTPLENTNGHTSKDIAID